jgi:hypothetical protein
VTAQSLQGLLKRKITGLALREEIDCEAGFARSQSELLHDLAGCVDLLLGDAPICFGEVAHGLKGRSEESVLHGLCWRCACTLGTLLDLRIDVMTRERTQEGACRPTDQKTHQSTQNLALHRHRHLSSRFPLKLTPSRGR